MKKKILDNLESMLPKVDERIKCIQYFNKQEVLDKIDDFINNMQTRNSILFFLID